MLRSEIRDKWERQTKTAVSWETEMLEQEARLACALLERWGMVMGEPNGEDTAGRQKLKIMSPARLVKRAFAVAELTMAEAKKRGLMHTVAELPYSVEFTATESKVDTSTPSSNT